MAGVVDVGPNLGDASRWRLWTTWPLDACRRYVGVVSVISIERLPSDPLAALRELAAGEAQLARLRREHVAAARAGGASWDEVGRALGVSEDAVLEYYFADARSDLAEHAGANDGDLSDEHAMELAVAEVRAVRRSMPPA